VTTKVTEVRHWPGRKAKLRRILGIFLRERRRTDT